MLERVRCAVLGVSVMYKQGFSSQACEVPKL